MGNCLKPVDPVSASIPRSSGLDATAVKISALPIIFIIGGPGAGKRTQCAKVAEKYGFLSIISSDILRREMATRSERAFVIARLMSEGRLVPPDVLLELIKVKMLNHLDNTKGFILSGFPREREQCRLFDKQVRSPDLVLYLTVRNTLLRERIMSRVVTITERQDVSNDTIKKRIKEFRKMNRPIIKYYKHILVTIDGEKDVGSVFDDICKAIDNIQKNVPATSAV